MDDRRSAKRRRTVRTCGECHRRKQKCDRAKPCNVCLERNVPEKCFYGDASASEDVKVNWEGIMPVNARQTRHDQEIFPYTGLSLPEQVGYSSTIENNAFMSLQKSLQQESYLPHLTANSTRSALAPDVWKRFVDIISQLPSQDVAWELFDVFFVEANWFLSILERCYFGTLFNHSYCLNKTITGDGDPGNTPRELQHFSALLFQTLAMALQFLPPGSVCARVLRIEDSAA